MDSWGWASSAFLVVGRVAVHRLTTRISKDLAILRRVIVVEILNATTQRASALGSNSVDGLEVAGTEGIAADARPSTVVSIAAVHVVGVGGVVIAVNGASISAVIVATTAIGLGVAAVDVPEGCSLVHCAVGLGADGRAEGAGSGGAGLSARAHTRRALVVTAKSPAGGADAISLEADTMGTTEATVGLTGNVRHASVRSTTRANLQDVSLWPAEHDFLPEIGIGVVGLPVNQESEVVAARHQRTGVVNIDGTTSLSHGELGAINND